MATLNTTTSNIFLPEVWTKEIEFARDNAFVVANLVERKHETDLNYGKTVHVPFVGNLADADNVVPGTPVNPVAPTETEVQILINKYKAKAVQISDIVKTQSKYNLAETYGTQIGKVLARAVDADVLLELRTGSTNTALDSTTGATYTQIVNLVTGLDIKNVPLDDRAFVVNGKMMGDLRLMPEFTRYDAIGSVNPSVAKSATNSLIGFVYGIAVYMTNNIEVVTGTPPKDFNWLFHKSAIGLVVEETPKMEHDRTALNLADDIIGSTIYGLKTLRPDHSIALKRN